MLLLKVPNGYHHDYEREHDRKPNGVNGRANKDLNVSGESTVSRIGEFLAACCTLFVACVSTLNTVRDENAEKVHFDLLDAAPKVNGEIAFLVSNCSLTSHFPSSTTQNKHADYRTAPASVQNFFAKLAGEDMEIDAEKLQQVLNYALKKGKRCGEFHSLLSVSSSNF